MSKDNYNNIDEEESGNDSTQNHNIFDVEEDEQDRIPDRPLTVSRKKLFLKLFPQCGLVVTLTCKVMKMAQQTFYIWYRDDAEFAKAVDKARENMNDIVKDLLIEKIKQKETRAITYYLDRRHPEYKPTSKTEVVTGNKTLEDILKEDSEKINADETTTRGNNHEGGENSPGPEVSVGETLQDKKQEGGDSSVQAEQNTSVLLEKEDTQESNSEGTPEGHIKNHRRGPAPRLRS